jgi:hypothetical protein
MTSNRGPELRRVVAYLWAAPATMLGLVIALLALLSGGRVGCRGLIVEAYGGLPGKLLRGNRFWRGGAAMTLGHVILARDRACLESSRAHERVHVRQYERWGVFLIPVYVAVACSLRWRGFDPYLDHPFERGAFEERATD